jgi:hypothetical protein
MMKATICSAAQQEISPSNAHNNGCHDGDRVVVLSTFLLAAMMAIVW